MIHWHKSFNSHIYGVCDNNNILPPVLVLVTLDGLVCLRVGLVGMVQGNLKLIDVLCLNLKGSGVG